MKLRNWSNIKCSVPCWQSTSRQEECTFHAKVYGWFFDQLFGHFLDTFWTFFGKILETFTFQRMKLHYWSNIKCSVPCWQSTLRQEECTFCAKVYGVICYQNWLFGHVFETFFGFFLDNFLDIFSLRKNETTQLK